MAKTYIPAPNFSTAPPPDGPLDLGHILEDLSYSSIESPLNREGYVEIAHRLRPDKKSGFRKSRRELLSGEFGIFAKFLAFFGVGVQAEATFEKDASDILAIKTLETITFTPSKDYIEKSMAVDGVKIHMEACDYKDTLFLVTGLKIAREASLESSLNKKFGGKVEFGFSHPGVPTEAGPRLGVSNSRSEGESFDGSTDFILAIRVKKIRYREEKLVTEEYNEGATMMDDVTRQRQSIILEDTSDEIGLRDIPNSKGLQLAESSDYDGDELFFLALPNAF